MATNPPPPEGSMDAPTTKTKYYRDPPLSPHLACTSNSAGNEIGIFGIRILAGREGVEKGIICNGCVSMPSNTCASFHTSWAFF